MIIEKAKKENIKRILEIYENARSFMYKNGNTTQWINYPDKKIVLEDIDRECLYLCKDKDVILGVFFYEFGNDTCYSSIQGKWLNEEDYGVVHRIAVDTIKKGVGRFCIEFAINDCKNLKIDTHENNLPMRNLLTKMGFSYCGIITLQNGDTRLAYQITKV